MPPFRKRVLYVEDDIDSFELLSAILQDYEVIKASTIDEALAHFRDNSFHYIILDQNLPDGNGLELFNRIRLSDKRTPVVFITGHDDLDTGQLLNCDGVIRKSSADFYDRVMSFVDRDPPSSIH
jgi:DNA-binding response OmpR family regulator